MEQSSLCPVPTEQQPVNEYQELKDSWLFRWATLDLSDYVKRLTCVWAWSWLIAGPLAAASFVPQKEPGHFLLCGIAGATIAVALMLLRLYLGWFYVRDRLQRETIFYEESGWYDGQTWTKTPEILARDRLLVTYQIEPIMGRLKRTFGFMALGFAIGSLIWLVL